MRQQAGKNDCRCSHLRIPPTRMTQHQVEQQVLELLSTYGHSQLPTMGEVHLRLTTWWMVLLEVYLPVRPVKGPVVAKPTLQCPQLGPDEPARMPLWQPLQDCCRTELTVGIRLKQRLHLTLIYTLERVRPVSPRFSSLLLFRRQLCSLPLPC